MTEQWAPIDGFQGSYEVSDSGLVRSLDRRVEFADGRVARYRGRTLHQSKSGSGYLTVALLRNGRRKTVAVHRVVAETFVDGQTPTLSALHRDGDSHNNSARNLYWGTLAQNAADAVRHGTHNMASRTHCPAGHPYTEENTYVRPGRATRECRTCRRTATETPLH